MTWAQDYRFTDPLRDLRGDAEKANELRLELERELSPGHMLGGVHFQVIAQALPQDEVLVETDDGRIALVHMTWSGRAESPPWPTTEIVDSAEHLQNVLESRY